MESSFRTAAWCNAACMGMSCGMHAACPRRVTAVQCARERNRAGASAPVVQLAIRYRAACTSESVARRYGIFPCALHGALLRSEGSFSRTPRCSACEASAATGTMRADYGRMDMHSLRIALVLINAAIYGYCIRLWMRRERRERQTTPDDGTASDPAAIDITRLSASKAGETTSVRPTSSDPVVRPTVSPLAYLRRAR